MRAVYWTLALLPSLGEGAFHSPQRYSRPEVKLTLNLRGPVVDPTRLDTLNWRLSHKTSPFKRLLVTLRGGATILTTSVSSPQNWLLPALACATSYALYNLFIKQAATADMDPILGGVILQVVAAGIGTVLWLFKRVQVNGSTSGSMIITRKGMIWSVAAGIAVGAAEILSFIVSGKGVPATQSIPIIVGGSIVIGTLLGYLWLRERLTRTGWLGVVLIAVGIALAANDPGASIGH